MEEINNMIRNLKKFIATKVMRKHFIVKKQKKLLSLLINENTDIIKKYSDCKEANNKIEKNIFIFWYQGLDNAPDLVKECVKSTKKHSKGFKVHIITKDNYKEYVTLEKNILDKLYDGKISLIHFSDILRFNLIKKYGGIWVDATIYITNDIFDEFSNCHFNTIKLPSNRYYEFVSKGKFTGFFIAGSKESLLANFMCEMFNNYWKKHDELIEYFLIDYFIEIAYLKIKDFKKEIDNIKESNIGIYELCKHLSLEYKKDDFKKLIKETSIHKLSYKVELNKTTEDNKITYYGKLFK